MRFRQVSGVIVCGLVAWMLTPAMPWAAQAPEAEHGGQQGMHSGLSGMRVAVLAADDFEDSELTEPVKFLRMHGVEVTMVGLEAGKTIKGKRGTQVNVDVAVTDADDDRYHALVIPGGSSPKHLRTNEGVLDFVEDMDEAGKPIAAICHGPQVLISAGLVKDKDLTCWKGVSEELQEAGARYHDRAVVVDGNFITSRNPDDIPAFNRALAKALHEHLMKAGDEADDAADDGDDDP